ncbi:VWA domain-containing protein [Tessaracoccus sp.]
MIELIAWPEFKTPARLWVLMALPVLVGAYLLLMRLRGRVSLRFTNTGVLGAVMGSQRRWTRHVAVAMSLCSLVALGLAWAQPLGTERVPRQRATVVMVVDTSLSMQATDVDPDRLTAAKQGAKTFIDGLPDSYNVALVSLNGQPSIKMPPSTDRGALERALMGLEVEDGTAIGDSLALALKAVEQAPVAENEEPAPAMVVMLSDGANTVGEGIDAAVRTAQQAKIPVFTIAYGTQNGYVDLDGTRENVAPDVATMKKLSQATDGKAVNADSADSLADAYKEIGSSVGYEEIRKPITAQYAFGALGFAIVAALGAVMMAARWPR